MTDADLFGTAPDTPQAQQGDPAVWTVLGEAGGHQEGQKAVASTIINRANRRGSTPQDIVSDSNEGYEAWTPAARAKLQKQYPVGSPEYEAAKANVTPILTGQTPAPYAYDTFYSPEAQKAKGRQPPNWEDGSGVDLGGNRFFAGKYSAPPILSDADKAEWERIQGGRPVEITQTPSTPFPGAPAVNQADTVKFLHLHGFMSPDAKPGSSQLPLVETDKSGPPTEPGAWYIPREGGLRQVGSPVPDYLPSYRQLVGRQQQEAARPIADRVAAGLGQGLYDVPASLNKLTGGALAIPDPMTMAMAPDLAQGMAQGSLQDYQTARNRFDLLHGPDVAAQVGRFGGNVAATAPLMMVSEGALGALGTGLRGAAPVTGPALDFLGGQTGGNLLMRGASKATQGSLQGSEMTALNSARSDRPLGEQLQHGAELGAGLSVLPTFAGGILGRLSEAPNVTPEVANLADLATRQYGIPLRRSQILGVADRSTALHDSQMIGRTGTGYAENNAAQQQAFARAASRTIGEDAPLTPAVMDQARRRIGGVFEQAAQNTGIAADDQLRSDLARVGSQARELGLDQSQINALDMQIGKITDQAARHGDVIPGDVYQSLTESGSSLSRIMKNDHSSFADLASDIRGALDDAVTRAASPEDVAALRQAKFQWKNLKTLQPLAAKAGPDGNISPTLLRGRVAAQFPDFAYGGGGDLGDLARIGQTFMKETGNSQTAPRIAEMIKHNALALGFGGSAEGMLAMENPVLAAKLAAAAGLAGGSRVAANAAESAYNRSPSVVNRLIRRGQQPVDLNPSRSVVDRVGSVVGPAYVPLGVAADRNKLLPGGDLLP